MHRRNHRTRSLTISWQRLLDELGRTCPRCATTGANVAAAIKTLTRSLRPMGIVVRAQAKSMSLRSFRKNPASSNLIRIAGKPLESWLGAKTGKSRCCGACGSAPCRTLKVGDVSYEAVPARLIIRAARIAARSLTRASD